jgi:hypothetical protein
MERALASPYHGRMQESVARVQKDRRKEEAREEEAVAEAAGERRGCPSGVS